MMQAATLRQDASVDVEGPVPWVEAAPRESLQPWVRGRLDAAAATAMWRLGFASNDAAEWYETVSATCPGRGSHEVSDAALVWASSGFHHGDVADWWRALDGSCEPSVAGAMARRWEDRGFTPFSAAPWIDPGLAVEPFTPRWAEFCRDGGWSFAHAALADMLLRRDGRAREKVIREWIESGVPPLHALDFIKAGVSADEGENLFACMDDDDLRALLQDKFLRLSPVDPLYASWINHRVFLSWGEEPPEGHLCLERIRDVHDTENEDAQQAIVESLFGPPGANGVYLVGVVEFSADANEDGWLYASMLAEGELRRAVARLNMSERDLRIGSRNDDALVGVAPDGTTLAVMIISKDRAKPWYRVTRAPSDAEYERWADRVVRVEV